MVVMKKRARKKATTEKNILQTPRSVETKIDSRVISMENNRCLSITNVLYLRIGKICKAEILGMGGF